MLFLLVWLVTKMFFEVCCCWDRALNDFIRFIFNILYSEEFYTCCTYHDLLSQWFYMSCYLVVIVLNVSICKKKEWIQKKPRSVWNTPKQIETFWISQVFLYLGWEIIRCTHGQLFFLTIFFFLLFLTVFKNLNCIFMPFDTN